MPGRGLRDVEQAAELSHLVEEGARQLQIEELRDAGAEVVEPLDAEGRGHAIRAPERVDEHGDVEAFDALEQQRDVGVAIAFTHAIDDLGDLEIARDLRADAT